MEKPESRYLSTTYIIVEKTLREVLFAIIMGISAQISCVHRIAMEIDPSGHLVQPICKNYFGDEQIPQSTRKEICMNEFRRLIIDAKALDREIKNTQQYEDKDGRRKTRNQYNRAKLQTACREILALIETINLAFGQEKLNGAGLSSDEIRELSIGEGFCRDRP